MTEAAACTHGAHPAPSPADLAASMEHAEALSVRRGYRWTEPRRRVYELLLEAGGPMKAYDLMDSYAEDRSVKPPTVYRALEFLEQSGLVHRIASLQAFVACDGGEPSHTAAFLICDCCGAVEEFDPGQVGSAAAVAKAHGFKTRTVALEVRGQCERCA